MTEMTTAPGVGTDADRQLKTKHRTMWAWGDYPLLATEVIASLGPTLVEAAGIGAGDRVLDVGAGSGNASLPAAALGARVVASDLTPELLEAGRRQAEERGLTLEWREADAEALPFDDGSFDVVMSSVGVMFAPHHQASADELVRVCRDGGTIALLNWTPSGFIGQVFAAMKGFVPPPPPGVQPPPLWGDEDHVRGLLGERVSDVHAERQSLRVDRFPELADFCEYFKSYYGPTIAAYKAVANDQAKVVALDEALTEVASRFRAGDDATTMEWEYLLLTCKVAASHSQE